MAGNAELLSTMKVLVADDEPFSLSIVVRMVRDLGAAEIMQASNGFQALDVLNVVKLGLAFAVIDFNMPEQNGLQVLKLIRTGKTGCPRDLKVLMLTGNSDFGLVGAAMALDVDAFIIKPISVSALSQRLTKVLPENRELKSIEHYETVNIDEVAKRLLSRKPIGTQKPKADPKKPEPFGLKKRTELLQPGAVLSEEIRSPQGELLLGKATVLTDRLIRRLNELKGAINLEYVYIFPENKEEQ